MTYRSQPPVREPYAAARKECARALFDWLGTSVIVETVNYDGNYTVAAQKADQHGTRRVEVYIGCATVRVTFTNPFGDGSIQQAVPFPHRMDLLVGDVEKLLVIPRTSGGLQ